MNIQPRGILSFAFGSILSWNIPFLSMIPSTLCRGPTPSLLKQPQTIQFPPQCLTVGSWYFGLFRWPTGRRTYLIPSDPNKLNFDSSLHNTFDHCWGVHPKCSLANLNRALRFLTDMNGFFTGRLPNNLFCHKRRFMVAIEQVNWYVYRNSLWIEVDVFRESIFEARTILSCRCVVTFGLPSFGKIWQLPRWRYFFNVFPTVDFGMLKSVAICRIVLPLQDAWTISCLTSLLRYLWFLIYKTLYNLLIYANFSRKRMLTKSFLK